MSDTVERVHHSLLESRLNKDQTLAVKSALTIVEILVSAKCCFRCCLRFLGCTNFGLYALEETVKYMKLFKKKEKEKIKVIHHFIYSNYMMHLINFYNKTVKSTTMLLIIQFVQLV